MSPHGKAKPAASGKDAKASSEYQSLGSDTIQIIEESERQALSKSVSFLSPDAVRWINRRQPASSSVAHARVLPARALQLREIFQGLDFDNSGSIDIQELKEALDYVARTSMSGETPVLKDPQKLTEFFVSMDTNHDGTVDFNEFLIAMTAKNEADDSHHATNRLQEAFFEFANHHQRQKILDFVDNPTYTDIEKYQEMKALFRIQYFKEEQLDLSTAEKLLRVKQQAQKQMKEIRTKQYVQQRHTEQIRAREAILYFKDQKRAGRERSLSPRYSPNLLDKEITESEVALRKAEKQIRQKFAEHSLHMEKTFTPDSRSVAVVKAPEESTRMRAKAEAARVKTDKYLVKHLPPIVPPVSIRTKQANTPH